MATIATARCSRARRRAASSTSFIPGFYIALNSQTSADCSVCTINERPKSLSLLSQVTGAADLELPPGCYLVERLIAVRKNKVCCAS